ncbi:MAG: hypothetical protein RJA31_543 [Actinomycetota bacterium]|jgi:hypothetical protein
MTDATEPTRLGERERVLFAALGGLYLGLTVAWLFAVQANQLIGIDDTFQVAMMNFGEFFAIVAAPLWFFATFSQITTTTRRVVSLAIGLVVLFPFPLFFGVTG